MVGTCSEPGSGFAHRELLMCFGLGFDDANKPKTANSFTRRNLKLRVRNGCPELVHSKALELISRCCRKRVMPLPMRRHRNEAEAEGDASCPSTPQP